jgi:hypothetical protein
METRLACLQRTMRMVQCERQSSVLPKWACKTWDKPVIELLLALIFGFVVGFGVRDAISRRRRREISRRYDRIGQ